MDALHVDLWRRICAFQLDGAGDEFTFTTRLARENDWSIGYATRVVDEYRRFVFLAMTAGHEVTPSDAIDQAWHLHLTYTQSYWDGLCREVLGRPLHHVPTKGGRDESARFDDQYKRTLASYRETFDEEPPANVWPRVESKSVAKPQFKRVNVTDSWVVPKPWVGFRRVFRTSTSGAMCCVAPIAVLAMTDPLDLKGPEFLVFYALVVGVTILVALLLRYSLRAGEDASPNQLTPYQVACLSGGVAGIVRAAIVSLIDRKAVRIVKSKVTDNGKQDYRPVNLHGVEIGDDEVEKYVLSASNTPEGCYLIDAFRAAEPAAEKIHFRLQAWGLMTQSDRATGCQLVPFLFMAAVTLLGIAKIVVGFSRGKPIEFLLLMVVVTGVMTFFFLKRPLRTRAGDALLSRIRQENRPLIEPKVGEASRLNGEVAILAAALFGLPAIAFGEFASMPDAWKYRAGPNATAIGSGCGSSFSCGGGGGCGGGGCGGGCGGCGGH